MDISGIKAKSAISEYDARSGVPNAQNQLDFTEILGKRTAAQTKPDAAKIRETAETFVAVALVQPVFKQLRSTNHAEAPFGPNKAEQQFQSLVDAQLARKMVHKSHWPVVDKVAQNMLKKAGLAPSE